MLEVLSNITAHNTFIKSTRYIAQKTRNFHERKKGWNKNKGKRD